MESCRESAKYTPAVMPGSVTGEKGDTAVDALAALHQAGVGYRFTQLR